MEWMRPVLKELVANRAALRAIDDAILEAHTTSDFDGARAGRGSAGHNCTRNVADA
jgi:hypothetical protein